MIELDHDTPIQFTVFKDQYTTEPVQLVSGPFTKLLNFIQKPKIGDKNTNYCFVGGEVKGKRNNENTVSRSLITIDYDDIPVDIDFYSEVASKLDAGFAIYSTHNHKPEAPRFRLVIPLDKTYKLTPDEYRASVQYIATKILEMDFYDPASEVLSQVMFLPTVNENNVDNYIFKYVDEEPLELEPILAVAEVQRSIKHKPLVDDDTWQTILKGLSEGEYIGRNSAMTKIVGHLITKNVNPTVIYYLLSYWDEHNEPSLQDEGQFDTVFKSIYNKHRREV
ncbi:primase alpha helix C-terminal domain-containing protein [Staphylococcus lloydii]|uniref:primase alpha helix C-terminal domain-containing protein n=1 Tax=Staphylococcus lloydii TaxID=2781774 RepID=UPI002927E276|nr:primase alpha helix C-terminal domain-containing protein [Staphylococcus lloydii]MDU9418082.1 primase alpha helix C-terminal domain-containing protein [Staphylococcus lloydii]